MKKLDWIKDLVESERRMEETGIIDLSGITDEARDVELRTQEFLRELKENFVDYSSAFNNLKNSTLGSIKIYGISNTVADFMLFRNGYKLLFSAVGPGRISISFQSQTTQLIPRSQPSMIPTAQEDILEAQLGPFSEVSWTFQGASVESDTLVRHYLSRFIRESMK